MVAQTVDARGLACPQPVIRTRKAMAQAEAVVTLVDNETAVTNVSRMAQKAGWTVEVREAGGDYRVQMHKDGAGMRAPAPAPTIGRAEAAAGPLVLVVQSHIMGRGNAELGEILVRGFFHTVGEVQPRPDTIIFFNSGARLACAGSPVLDDLHALEAAGVEILVCGTCLDYFEIKDQLAAGIVSNMYDIAEAMLGAGKVVNL